MTVESIDELVESQGELALRPQGPQGVVMVKIGGTFIAEKSVPQCRVCQSEYRLEIETGLCSGLLYAAIEKTLPTEAGINRNNIRQHAKNHHMGLRQSTTRALIDQRAEEMGDRIVDGTISVVDHITLARVVVQKVFERMADGDDAPSISDGLAAAKLLQQVNYDDDGFDRTVYTELVMRLYEEIGKVMTAEQYERLGRNLQTDPAFRALMRKARGESNDIEGEALDTSMIRED